MNLSQLEEVLRGIDQLLEAKKTDYFSTKGSKTFDYFDDKKKKKDKKQKKDKPKKKDTKKKKDIGKSLKGGGVSGHKKKGINKKKPINRSAMYKHMTVAIYDAIKGTGYARGTDAEAARRIARGQMIKHGYARRARNRKTREVDRRQIKLTGKGKRRSSKHAREPAGVRRKKDKKFAQIATQK